MSTMTPTASLRPLGAAAVPAPSSDNASATAWIAVLAGMVGAFMAILNIQITNASLLDIEGGIGTGVDNGAWISTSYLIGEIVVIPLTDYLSRVFSFRRYILANGILFPLFSIGCAFSAASTSCRSTSARCSATTPSRPATCWPGRGCPSCS